MIIKTLILYLLFTSGILGKMADIKKKKNGKVLSLFNIVTFENAVCATASSARRGTCYTASECNNRGGSASGSCAAGFGVCCLFIVSTTATITQNCTYLRSEGFPGGFTGTTGPEFTIQKCSSGVCSLRLDFETFSITGPTGAVELNGGECETERLVITVNNLDIDAVNLRVNKSDDSLIPFQSSTGEPFPTICGENGGQHVYVDMGAMASNTATLAFTLSNAASMFEIKVSQIPCGSNYTPPDGCFQYFTAIQGTISTFNFIDTETSHLQNQRYTTCIRRGFGMCCIQYTICSDANSMSLAATAPLDINGAGNTNNNAVDSLCGNDYVIIQGIHNE